MSAAFIPFLVPIGLLLFLLEVYFLRKNQIKITLEQTALNISLGFLERLLGLYLTEKSILLVNKSLDFAFFETLPKTWWVLAITFSNTLLRRSLRRHSRPTSFTGASDRKQLFPRGPFLHSLETGSQVGAAVQVSRSR